MFGRLFGPPEKGPTAEAGYTPVVLGVWLAVLGGLRAAVANACVVDVFGVVCS